MAQIKLAFVGVGSMGQAAHLRNYCTLPACKVVALAEKRARLGAEVARRFGVDRVYDDFEEMLTNEEIDGIVAIQQFEMHGVLVPRLLKKGVPVLTEKPLAASFDQGQTILNAVRQGAASLFLAYHKRSDPAVTYAKKTMQELAETGELGALKYIRITMPPGDWSVAAFASNVTTEENFESGSPVEVNQEFTTFVNYYIHQVNLMRFLLGEDYRVVYADSKGITMTVESASGVVGMLEMAPFETTSDWQESALICYDRGWIRVDLPAPLVIDQAGRVTVYKSLPNASSTFSPTLKPWHAMRMQAANFLAAIRGESHPLCEAEEGLKDLEIAQNYLSLLSRARQR